MTNEKMFYETVRSGMQTLLGNEYDCEVQQIVKVNITLDGLVIHEQGNSVSPTIYLNQYFHEYEAGKSVDEILQEILLVFESNRKSEKDFGVKEMYDYCNIQKAVVLKVINAKQNIKLLKTVPHILMDELGLATVFYVPVKLTTEYVAGFMVTNQQMKLWNIPLEELLNAAKQNTKSNLKYVVRSMEDILVNLLDEEQATEMDLANASSGMYVLVDEPSKRFGASCMFQTDAIAKFAKMQNCDLYILPSSICELILLRADFPGLDVSELREMVQQVNREQVAAEEVLSDDVFKYIRNENKIVKM